MRAVLVQVQCLVIQYQRRREQFCVGLICPGAGSNSKNCSGRSTKKETTKKFAKCKNCKILDPATFPQTPHSKTAFCGVFKKMENIRAPARQAGAQIFQILENPRTLNNCPCLRPRKRKPGTHIHSHTYTHHSRPPPPKGKYPELFFFNQTLHLEKKRNILAPRKKKGIPAAVHLRPHLAPRRVQGLGSRVQCLGFRQDTRSHSSSTRPCTSEGLGFRVQGSVSRVQVGYPDPFIFNQTLHLGGKC